MEIDFDKLYLDENKKEVLIEEREIYSSLMKTLSSFVMKVGQHLQACIENNKDDRCKNECDRYKQANIIRYKELEHMILEVYQVIVSKGGSYEYGTSDILSMLARNQKYYSPIYNEIEHRDNLSKEIRDLKYEALRIINEENNKCSRYIDEEDFEKLNINKFIKDIKVEKRDKVRAKFDKIKNSIDLLKNKIEESRERDKAHTMRL